MRVYTYTNIGLMLGALVVGSTMRTAGAATIIANDSFERDALPPWTSLAIDGSVEISTDLAYEGSRSLKSVNNGPTTGAESLVFAVQEPNPGSGYSEVYWRAFFNITQNSAEEDLPIMAGIGAGNLGYPAIIGIDTAGKLYAETTANLGAGFGRYRNTSSQTVALNEWHYLELHYRQDAVNPNGLLEVWYDDDSTPDIAISGYPTQYQIGLFRIGSSTGSEIPTGVFSTNAATVYFDNIAADSSERVGVPEPTSLSLLGVCGLLALKRRRG